MIAITRYLEKIMRHIEEVKMGDAREQFFFGGMGVNFFIIGGRLIDRLSAD